MERLGVFSLVFAALAFKSALGQQGQQPPTDPTEVEALKLFGEAIGLSPPWDFSVDPCTGLNGWGNTKGAPTFQPSSGVECDCTLSNTSCHVVKLVVISIFVEGTISPAIGNLTYLADLNLQANRISGTLPEELGSLTNLQYLTVASNRLTGSIPRSIGNLKELASLSIAVNNFTGTTVPKELGNLTSLRELYMDSTGLGGELPEEFAKLQNLKTLNMFDNNFNGTIPAFLGNMSSLQVLKIFGNKFTGSIPSNLGSLSKLEVLEIGELVGGGVIPSTFNSLKELTSLSLRNCELSGTIPELNLTKLTSLDLSFNNLTGSIPTILASLPLRRLYLGSNNLSGALPTFGSLTALDVSFNQLTGAVPQLNGNTSLVWNRFSDNPSTVGAEDCLLETQNCRNVNGGSNSRFAINCGGPELTVDGTTFSMDRADFSNGSGTYFSPQAWTLASSGYDDSFKTFPAYLESIKDSSGARSTLYQTARTAPTSLRYLGVGMRTGSYTVRLYFAEIIIGISSDNPGLGRRFFDVYVQGDRKLQDFSIRDEAGESAKAVVRTFRGINVTSGIIDIHFLWRGKGTCCAPFRTYGPLVSAIEVSPEFETGESGGGGGSSSNGVKVGVPVALAVLALLGVFVFLFWRSRRKLEEDEDAQELKLLGGKLNIYTYNELRAATKDFNVENLVGKGAFGSVYKGALNDGTVIAVKQLVKTNQSTKEFVNEATLISSVQHRNLVKLLGCCVEGDNRILVFEFLENGNLYQFVLSKDRKVNVDWPTRFSICLGVARGLAYLHEESFPRIIHRDIKATNVLLDKSLVPKIGDFGLAKLFDDQQSHISNTRVAGTTGYLAPEYAMRGLLTEKADVYSYGILLLEIVCGRPNMYSTSDAGDHVSDYAWQLYEANRALELLDRTAENADEDQVLRVIQIALMCTQATPAARPTMSKVVAMLTGSEPVNVSSLVPGYFAPRLLPFPSTSTSGATSGATSGTTSGTVSRGGENDSPWKGSSTRSIEPR